ncbi:MAG: HEAT repeat domain-containing protein [Pirellulales bacterium]
MNFAARLPRTLHALVAIAAVGCCHARFAGEASAATFSPQSPEVKNAVASAVAFLEKAPLDDRLGALALAAHVMVFQGKPDHPLVGRAIDAVRRTVKQHDVHDVTLIYSLGLSLVFLSELDPEKYREELGAVAQLLAQRQKRHGGWGYSNRPTGDTSMTQYAVYGLWSAGKQGIKVDESVCAAQDWMTSVQDVGGAWPYQGVVPETPQRITQDDLRRSMTEAAMATLYLTGNHFGTFDFEPKPEKSGVSSLLKPVNAPVVESRPRIDPRELNTALSAGGNWLRNTKDGYNTMFPYYHLYTIERMQSFRSAALKTFEADAWYDSGVRYLFDKQAADGGWDGSEGRVAGTSFAILFLIRSTRATLERALPLGPGTLVGGRGLPTTRPRRAMDATPGVESAQKIDDVIRRLDDPNFVSSLNGLQDLQPIKDTPAPSELTKRLLELAQGDSPEAKGAALRALGKSRDVATAPILIEALLDPSPTVHQAAVDGLRFMTRDTDNYGKLLAADPVVRSVEAEKWRQWYRKIRPVGP